MQRKKFIVLALHDVHDKGILHEVKLPSSSGALLDAEPLVHIDMHCGIVNALGLVVPHKVHAQQRCPGAWVAVHVQRRAVACKALLACIITRCEYYKNAFAGELLSNGSKLL